MAGCNLSKVRMIVLCSHLPRANFINTGRFTAYLVLQSLHISSRQVAYTGALIRFLDRFIHPSSILFRFYSSIF